MSAASFDFTAPGRILFGPGRAVEAGPALAQLLSSYPASGGSAVPPGPSEAETRILLVSGGDPARLEGIRASLKSAKLESVEFAIKREPRFDDARSALALARESGCRAVVGFGGGSALDLAKAVAALLANPGDPLDYAEVIGGGRALSAASIPCVAIPTTAGTGSEATRNAVLASEERRVKVSLRSPTMVPALAVVDPLLCLSLPPRPTADTGMDALTQVIEPYVCVSPNSLVDALCLEAISRIQRSLPQVYRDGADAEARLDLSWASLAGGLALANARLGAVHGLAGPLGGLLPVPHGAACAALLAPTTAANVAALRSRAPDHPALDRYARVAALLRRGRSSGPEDAAPALAELAARLDVRSLREFGLQLTDLDAVSVAAEAASSMRGNPIRLERAELLGILEAAY